MNEWILILVTFPVLSNLKYDSFKRSAKKHSMIAVHASQPLLKFKKFNLLDK